MKFFGQFFGARLDKFRPESKHLSEITSLAVGSPVKSTLPATPWSRLYIWLCRSFWVCRVYLPCFCMSKLKIWKKVEVVFRWMWPTETRATILAAGYAFPYYLLVPLYISLIDNGDGSMYIPPGKPTVLYINHSWNIPQIFPGLK